MGLNLNYLDGQTPLDDDEREGLLIQSISNRGELDEFEQLNIEKAILWSIRKSFQSEMVFTMEFVMALHKRMFDDVWEWAGKCRKSNKNIGPVYWKIQTELKTLLDDASYWFEHQSHSPDEFALRFKHRLVSIHCFPNGNGRHSRLMADIIIEKLFKKEVFSWGSRLNLDSESVRKLYLKAVKAADSNNYNLLLEFARS